MTFLDRWMGIQICNLWKKAVATLHLIRRSAKIVCICAASPSPVETEVICCIPLTRCTCVTMALKGATSAFVPGVSQ